MKEWKLLDFHLNYNTYGENKGKYTGRVKYVFTENIETGTEITDEMFVINISAEDGKKILDILKKQIVSTANDFAEKITLYSNEKLGNNQQDNRK